MEKPILLLVNIAASVALGLGISQYMTQWLDRPYIASAPKTISVAKKAESSRQVALQAPLIKDAQADEETSPTPSVSPTPTSSKNSVTPTPTPEWPEKNTSTKTQSISTTPTPTTNAKPAPTASSAPSPKLTEKPAPKKSIVRETKNVADTVLQNLPSNH